MTTILSLKNEKLALALLAGDRQGTFSDERGNPIGKRLTERKIWQSDDGLYVVGHAGRFGDEAEALVGRLRSGDIDVQKIISDENFPELREMNHDLMGGGDPNLAATSGLLLATRFDGKPSVYKCFTGGDVKPAGLVYLGSGTPRVEEYFHSLEVIGEARNYLPRHEATREDMVRVGLEAVRYSQGKDIFSSGLDLMVVTPDGITDHYADLGDDFPKKLRRIQKSHKQAKEVSKEK